MTKTNSCIFRYAGDCWLNDLWKYDIETKHWTCIQESSGPSSAATATAVIASTSNNNSMNDNQNDELTVSNHNNNNKNSHSHGVMVPQQPVVQGKVPTRRFGYVSVVHNGKFVLFGGFDVRLYGWLFLSFLLEYYCIKNRMMVQ